MNSKIYIRFIATLACVLCASTPLFAQSHGEQSERNKEVVRLYIEGLWNDLRYELIEQILAPDLVAHAADGTQELGRDRFREAIPNLRNAFPDLHLTIEEMIAEGDRVALRLRARGTHKGDAFDMAPSGRVVDLPEWFFFRLSNGKIVEYSFLRDHAQLFNQMAPE